MIARTMVLTTSNGRHIEAPIEAWVGAIMMSMNDEDTQVVLNNLEKVMATKIHVYRQSDVKSQLAISPVRSEV